MFRGENFDCYECFLLVVLLVTKLVDDTLTQSVEVTKDCRKLDLKEYYGLASGGSRLVSALGG